MILSPAYESRRLSAKSLVLSATTLLVLAACGSTGSRAVATSSVVVSTAAAESTTPVPPTEAATTLAAKPDLNVLRDRIDQTVERRTAAFALNVNQTLPVPRPNGFSMIRTGVFDEQLSIGHGSVRFDAESVEIAQLWGAGKFEFRLLDDTFWTQNPFAEPPAWAGYDIVDYADSVGGDPTLALNGDLYLRVVAHAFTEATVHTRDPDGSETWTVMVDADDLLPLVTTSGVQQRLRAGGFEQTGILAAVTVFVDADGMVAGFEARMSEWWQQAVSVLLPEATSAATMNVLFTLRDFDSPVEAATPCADPRELKEPGFPDGFTCDA